MPKATRILFEGYDISTGTEPYLIDPATAVTSLVRNIARFDRSSTVAFGNNAAYFGSLAGGLTVFAADDDTEELWITDGTTAGTRKLVAINPGGTTDVPYFQDSRSTSFQEFKGSKPTNFTNLTTSTILFTAGSSATGRELWITDGTAAGTRLVSDVRPGTASSNPSQITALGDGRALFVADDGIHGTELWITDGTKAGTALVADLSPGSTSSFFDTLLTTSPQIFALGKGRAIFTAITGAGSGLWTTDGTSSGTTQMLPLLQGKGFARLGDGRLVFSGGDVPHGFEPWVTDGTPGGTHLIRDIHPGYLSGSLDSYAVGFGSLGDGRAVFFASEAGDAQPQLWITDGSASGTTPVREFGANLSNIAGSRFGFVQLADGRVSFIAHEGTGPYGIWVTDGTAAGTQRLGTGSPGNIQGGLSGSALVDAPFYVAHYADVAASSQTAAAHYSLSGWREGRDPSALFSTSGYLNTYKDVGAARIDPLAHYDQVGWKEGRDPSAFFDTRLYLVFNPDVAAAGLDPLAHYLANGVAEGRKTTDVVDSAKVSAGFDPTFYGLANPDVSAAGIDPLLHFLTSGVREQRNPDAFFDTASYLARNPDVAAAGVNPLTHYMTVGWKEGRDPSTHFSTTRYLGAYSDVRAAGINPLTHFLQNGIAEGRSAFGDRF